MQPIAATVMALLLAHLIADFPLQPDWIIGKKGRNLLPLLLHGAVHYALVWICLIFCGPVRFLSIRNQVIIAGCLIIHLVIDRLKFSLIARCVLPDNSTSFLADQLLHLVVLLITAILITRSHIPGLVEAMRISSSARFRILETAIIYTGIVFAGGYLIRYVTRGMAQVITEEVPAQLSNAGLYIGWLERALVITAMAMQSPALVGLILTGKSIARFPEFKEARFAEYYLIGTLLSFLLSVLGGVVLLYVLYGAVSLK
jgi:hypothetical protein